MAKFPKNNKPSAPKSRISKKAKHFNQGDALPAWREKIHEVIFEADTPLGKFFDISLIVIILFSVIAVMLDSMSSFHSEHGELLRLAEWGFTGLFAFEYILRLISVRKPLLYATSFLGVIDLMSILPSFIALLYPGAETLLVVRILRVLRIFRIFKLAEYLGEANALVLALKGSQKKISIFLYTVFIFVVIFGSVMYLVEGEENGFTSIPRSIYWAIITLTTVGYGDLVPRTDFGQMIAAAVMILGYAIIAVPTGIYSAELAKVVTNSKVNDFKSIEITRIACENCGEDGHDADAGFCKYCGSTL
ncbi:MAG: ion transporter [Kangiella sp.]|nr:MAG: ion transporter [Kangiella sp.]